MAKPLRPMPADHDPFDLWLRQDLRARWGHEPVLEPVPKDLLRLACDSRSEWAEMKERWSATQRRHASRLD